MKKLLIFFLLISCIAKGQNLPFVNATPTQYKELVADKLAIGIDTLIPPVHYNMRTTRSWLGFKNGVLYAWDPTQLKYIPAGSGGTLGVTSVGVAASGALSVSGSPVTSSGTITLGWSGSGTQYVKGDGTLATFSTSVTTITNPLYAPINHTHLSSQITDLTTAVRNMVSAGSGLVYNSSTGVFSFPGAGTGITSLNTLTGSDQTLVTGTSGTDFAIVSSGASHTFNLPTVSGSNRGVVTSALYTTWNAKQGAITLTTTGTSGAATFDGTTLNIPQYTGTAYTDEQAQDAVGAMVSGEFTYADATPLLSINSIAATKITGTKTSSFISDFTTAAQGSISLTTTGTSGAATYTGGVFNIPNYTYTLPTASTTVLGGVKVDGTTITITGGVISSVGGYTDEQAQDAVGAMVSAEFTYTDGTPLLAINSIASTKITGTKTSAYISDFAAAVASAESDPTVDAIIKAIPVSADAATNKYLNWNGSAYIRKQIAYSEVSGTPSIPSQYTDEMAQDATATLIQDGTGITWSYIDGSNTLTPTVTITQYTDALARSAISLTTTGTSGASTYSSATGVLNVPNYTYTLPTASTTVLGGVKIDGTTITIDGSGVISAVAGSGEANTGSNLGGGLANYSTKVGVDLQFNSFAAADFDLGSNLITIDATKWLTISSAASTYQPLNSNLTTIAGLTATTNNFMVAVSSAWASVTPANALTALGGTTVGKNIFTVTNPSAITFIRINADNTVTLQTAANFRTDIGAGTGNGTVTTVSVVGANGFAGSVATATTTPAITISTSITGILKGNGTAISAAVSGTDLKTVNGTSIIGSGDITTTGFANPMTTLGDIITGGASGVATRLAGAAGFLKSTGAAAPTWSAVTKTDVGLSAVENTALSTWAGSTNIITLGTVTTGTWNGTDIAFTNIAQIAGLSVLGRSANTTGDVAAITGTDGQVLRVSGTTLGFGTVVSAGIADAAITLAKMADVATGTVFYRKTAATGVPEVQTLATLKTDLGLTGTNAGDQNLFASIPVSGQTTVTANSTTTALTFVAGTGMTITTDNTAKSITFASSGGYTDEQAQDAIGAMISAEFTYADATPLLSINSIASTKITGTKTSTYISDFTTAVQAAELDPLSFHIAGTSTMASAATFATAGNTLTISTATAATNPLSVSATTGQGIAIATTTGLPVGISKNSTTTTGVEAMINITRNSSGTAANNIAAALDFYIEASDGTTPNATRLLSTVTNVTPASFTSTFAIHVQNVNALTERFLLEGNGDLTLSGYPNSRNDGAVASGSTKIVYVDANGKLQVGTATFGTGTGSVTNFSAGDLSPLFTTTEATTTTTPALSFVLTNAAAKSVFGNFTNSSAAPSYNAAASADQVLIVNTGNTALTWGTVATGGITNSAVTLAKMADVATATVFYRKTAATGAPEVQTLATLKTDLGLTGTNAGDQNLFSNIPVSGQTTVTASTTTTALTFIAGTNVTITTDNSAKSITFNAATGATGANPTASAGLSAVNGSAGTFMRSDAAPALSQAIAPTWTALHSYDQPGIATTTTNAILLTNSTAATVGIQVQYSPAIEWLGRAWKSNATAASQTMQFKAEVKPVAGTSVISGAWVLGSQTNGAGGFNEVFKVTNTGVQTWPGILTSSAGSYVIVTQNTGTGVIEKVASSTFLTGNQTITLSSDVTGSGTTAITTTIAADAVTYAKMQNVSATARIMGRNTAGAGDMEELTGTNVTAMLDVFGTSTKGLVPSPGSVTGKVLSDNGTWVAAGTGTVNAGVTGYLAYYPSSASTVDDQAHVFLDNASGDLGLGTATPATVDGNALTTQHIFHNYSGTEPSRNAVSGTQASFDLVDIDASANSRWAVLSNSASKFYFKSLNDAGSTTFDFITLDLFSGYVGIFNTAPAVPFDVTGAARFTTYIDENETGAPSTPTTGLGRWYVNSTDSKAHFISDGGVDYDLTAGGSTSPGGSDTYVQFNDATAFGGDAGFVYNKTSDEIRVAGIADQGSYKLQVGGDTYAGGYLTVTGGSQIMVDDINNADVTEVLQIQHTTSGTPALGIATGIGFQTEAQASNIETGATILSVITDVGAATEDFDFVVKLMTNGTATGGAGGEKLRITSKGGLQMPEVTAPGTPPTGYVIMYAKADGRFYLKDDTGAEVLMSGAGGSGETNTASNLGGGLANYSTKVGVDLQFNSFAAADFDLASNVITIDATKWAPLASPAFTGIATTPTLQIPATTGRFFQGVTAQTSVLEVFNISETVTNASNTTPRSTAVITQNIQPTNNVAVNYRALDITAYGNSSGANDIYSLTGAYALATMAGTKNLTEGVGFQTLGYHQGSGTVGGMYGAIAIVHNVGVGTITEGAGLLVKTGVNNGGGTFTNNYGVLILDQTAGSNNWAIKTGTGKIEWGGAMNEFKGADIASATTTNIGAATGNYVDVTGTVTITGLGTIQAGTRRIVRFSGALILTHNATSLILPRGVNITTVAGDVAEFVSLGSGNWRCTNYLFATKQLFTATSTVAGMNVGSYAGEPSTLVDGDMWYNSSTGEMVMRAQGNTTYFASKSGSQSLTNKIIAYGSNTISGTIAQFNTAVTDADLATIAGTETLTNKRITQRVTAGTNSSTTPTPSADNEDMFILTALSVAPTFQIPGGTPTDGQKLTIRIKDNGTARVLAWNAIYRASTDQALPTTTVLSKTMYIAFMYNSADTKWDCVAVNNGF